MPTTHMHGPGILSAITENFRLHEERVRCLLRETRVYPVLSSTLSTTNPHEAIIQIEEARGPNWRLFRRPTGTVHQEWLLWLEQGVGRSVLVNRREMEMTPKSVAVTVLECWQGEGGDRSLSLETLVYKLCMQEGNMGCIVFKFGKDLVQGFGGRETLKSSIQGGDKSFVSTIKTPVVRLQGSTEAISVSCKVHKGEWSEPRVSVVAKDHLAGGLWMLEPSMCALKAFNDEIKSLIERGVIREITSSSLQHVGHHTAACVDLSTWQQHQRKYLIITPYPNDTQHIEALRATLAVPQTPYKNTVQICNAGLWDTTRARGYARYADCNQFQEIAQVICQAILAYKENDSVVDPEINIVWKHAHLYPMQVCLRMLTAIEELVTCLGNRVAVHVFADPFDVAPLVGGICPWRFAMADRQILRHPTTGHPNGVSRLHVLHSSAVGRLDTALRALTTASTGATFEADTPCIVTYQNEGEFETQNPTTRLRLLLANNQLGTGGERDAVVFYAGARHVAGAATAFTTPPKKTNRSKAKRHKPSPPSHQATLTTKTKLTLLTHATGIQNAQATRPGTEGDRCIIVPTMASPKAVKWFDIYAVLVRMPANATLHLIVPQTHLAELRAQIRSVNIPDALIAYVA